jgi:uncharacterized protein YjbI with pentapeptide repeats
MAPPLRLTQEAVNAAELTAIVEAAKSARRIDASGLRISAGFLARVLELLPVDESGGPLLENWSFVDAMFDPSVSFAGCRVASTRFDGARFAARASFQGARFSRAYFDRTTFDDDADFSDANLGQRALFRSAVFGARARFTQAVFISARFHDCSFGEQATFRKAAFSARARFGHSRFAGSPNFTSARFAQGADFGGVRFGPLAQMIGVHFGGDVSFVGAEFGERATHWRVDGRLTMRSARFSGPVSLHGARIGGDAVFKFAQFASTVDVGAVQVERNCSFTGATFLKADRVGPIRAEGALLYVRSSFYTACLLEADARILAMPSVRFLAPARIVVRRAAVVVNGLQASAPLVIAASPAAASATRARLVAAENADVGTLVVSGLDVRPLRLRGADNIDKLRLEAGAHFEPVPPGPRVAREAVAEEHVMRDNRKDAGSWYPAACHPGFRYPESKVDLAELARIYRGLRKAREDAKDAPGASDLYYGEMEMRRLRSSAGDTGGLVAWLSRAVEGTIIAAYKYGGGYGVRPSRPFLAFTAAILLGAALADSFDAVAFLPAGAAVAQAEPTPACFGKDVVFVLRSALLLPTPQAVLTSLGDTIQITLRLLGPLLIGLFALGLRARVHR